MKNKKIILKKNIPILCIKKNKYLTTKLVLLSKLINMRNMFHSCKELVSIKCSSNWINSKIIYMEKCFVVALL